MDAERERGIHKKTPATKFPAQREEPPPRAGKRVRRVRGFRKFPGNTRGGGDRWGGYLAQPFIVPLHCAACYCNQHLAQY